MKSLTQYIVEEIRIQKLNGELKDKFVKIADLYDSLLKNKTTDAIDIDKTKMQKPNMPISLKDYHDPNILNVLKNNTFGSQLTFDAVNNMKKIFNTDNINTDNVNVLPYFFSDGNNEYYVGCVMFTDNPQVVRGYANFMFIDTAKIVNNTQEILLAIYNDFITYLKDNTNRNNCLGIASAPQNNYVKKNMQIIGMKPSNVNKDIFIIKL